MPLTVELDERIWSKSQVKRLKELLEPGPFQFFKMEEDLEIALDNYAALKSLTESKKEDEETEMRKALDEAYYRLDEIKARLKEKKAALILEVLEDPNPRSTKKQKTLEEKQFGQDPQWSRHYDF